MQRDEVPGASGRGVAQHADGERGAADPRAALSDLKPAGPRGASHMAAPREPPERQARQRPSPARRAISARARPPAFPIATRTSSSARPKRRPDVSSPERTGTVNRSSVATAQREPARYAITSQHSAAECAYRARELTTARSEAAPEGAGSPVLSFAWDHAGLIAVGLERALSPRLGGLEYGGSL